ncbi:hypothetical protein [Pedobacter aquatilis]|uniref:hypothetical protein n=1 Tax=Pedobacter aquatilis TaxID=351343 RepID=UPI002931D657|nr:hypothetical protein [Pedobacter aquatilis]
MKRIFTITIILFAALSLKAQVKKSSFDGNFSIRIETEETTTGTASITYIFEIKKDYATLTTTTYHEPIRCNGSYKTLENDNILTLKYNGKEANCKSTTFTIKKQDNNYFIKGAGGEATYNTWLKLNKGK